MLPRIARATICMTRGDVAMNRAGPTPPASTVSGSSFDGSSVFERVVAGVDGTEAGLEAVRQASRLVAPDGRLEVFTATYLVEANLTGWTPEQVAAQLEEEAGAAIRQAKELAGPRADARHVNGPPLPSLLRELRESDATLAVLGTHGHGRLSEILIGGVVGELLHNAPCSVLVARPPLVRGLFPSKIVVGVDGSEEAEAAVATARHLAERFRARLYVVAALHDRSLHLERARKSSPVEVEQTPVQALTGVDADIVVVGSRGLHGVRALGSVSERVAHRCDCSVLVVHNEGGL
jgi:nucleotide-binding universal stress UspA family protein